MNARFDIGFARNEGPADADDAIAEAVAEWIAACPFAHALTPRTKSAIADYVETDALDWMESP